MKKHLLDRVTRRHFLAAAGSSLLLPKALKAQTPTNPDVVVVGAGAAGLSTAHTLMAAGYSVLVLEAAARIGGRAWAESETFGVPFDHGCSWINSAGVNPAKKLADEFGFETLNHDSADEALYVGNRPANDAEWAAYDNAWSVVSRAAEQISPDVAASSLMPDGLDFSSTVQSWIGPMDMGVDFKDLSSRGFSEGASADPSYMVKEGLGAVIARYGEDLPVRLNTPVTSIDWSGQGVSVETPEGTIQAKACVVTVSTGVLGQDAIAFTPGLPDWKRQAIDDVPMGLLVKVPLQFDSTRLAFSPNDWLTYKAPEALPAEVCYFLTWPFDFDLMIGFLGGDFGWEISREAPAAAVDFALGEVVKMVGSDARKAFVKGTVTQWANDPLVMGAYSAARPGRYESRADLARPLDERIFFAGEAVSGPYVATVGGALLSGKAAARDVAGALG